MIAKYLVSDDEDERAVSPVIGVILMVAITVILAAVIAAFVLDLGQSQSANINAGVDFSEDSDTVSVQLMQEGNADTLYVRVEGDAGNEGYAYLSSGTLNFQDSQTDSAFENVGDKIELTKDDLDADDSTRFDSDESVERITVIGELDGNTQVVQIWD